MYKLLSILSILVIISMLPTVLSAGTNNPNQPDTGDTIPSWIKNTAGWWADELIDDSSFVFSIQWLVTNDIIILSPTEQGIGGDDIVIPSWIKSTAGWWADDKIHDVVFVGAIRYLINEGIMVVMEPQVEEAKCNFKGKEVVCSSIEKEVVEINDFYMEVNGGTCSYCVNWAYVGEEYRFQIETFDEQHGKYIDDVKINVKIISNDGELRHNFGEVTTEDGLSKNSIIIPNMDWYAGNILSVTGEYLGVEKTIEKEFEVFKKSGALRSYGAGAGYCAEIGQTATSGVSVNSNDEAELQPQGFAFSKSGERMFMIGSTMDDVFEYDLNRSGTSINGGAYCLSTLSTPLTFFVNSKDNLPTGITFDKSGTKMFIVGKANDKVYQYNLTQPFFVNATATYSNAHTAYVFYAGAFSVASQENTPGGVTFDPSGTKMFVVGEASNTSNKGEVNAYDLSEPFDVASASHADVYTMSITGTVPTGIVFDASGTKMFISDSGTNTIRQYNLNEPYRITSNSTGDANTPSINVNSVDNNVRDVWFDASGTKMFILGQSGKDVNVYKLTEPFNVSTASAVS